ncbi:hypothetical protein OLX02_01825 [Novosphingobium sp. KCTC 2891]|uniref:hypothetical protein n=1 Tax=Novosphingobium sp. KCTC 2891 TaxID=2989730 RepID=UPI002221C467|nr:hypothetical protein [Novosphingobium sp. KCTC 2891]MCW1381552.1 hypothetical protein [Novosphingobium sp. KCTC 2891]
MTDSQATIMLTVGKATEGAHWFDRLVTLTGALAWPLVALVVALLFRAQLVALTARLDELRWGDKSARFARRLDRLEASAPFPPPPPPDEPEIALSGDHARFLQLLEISPGAAVLDAWARVEEGLARLARRADGGELDRRIRAMVVELGALRADAARNRPITVPDALRFRNLAKRVLNEINLA